MNLLQGMKLLTKQHHSFSIKDVFYHGTLNITSRTQDKICERNLTILCDFGSSYADVIATCILQNCNGKYNAYEYLYITD